MYYTKQICSQESIGSLYWYPWLTPLAFRLTLNWYRFKSKVTSCNHAWNIYLDSTCWTNNVQLYLLFSFIYWFISILILLIRSGYIIVSCYYSVSSDIFRAWLYEVIHIQIVTGYQLKRSQTKQVMKLSILCNYSMYWRKIQQSFP